MWPNQSENVDLTTFTEEILNGKLHFSCSVNACFKSIIDAKDGIEILVSRETLY